MNRYSITEYDAACTETRAIYDDFLLTTGRIEVPLWFKTLGHSPVLLKAYWEKAKGCLFNTNLPFALKEMVVFVVSAQNGARYCSACHGEAVLQLDKTLEHGDLIGMLQDNDQIPHAYRTAVLFAKKMAANANCLEDEDFESLHKAGYSDGDIAELIALVDLATMFNLYTSAYKIDLDPEFRAIL